VKNIAKFQELNTYTNDVLMKLVGSQNLCKYLKYATDKDVDPLLMPDLSEDERIELLFKNIFPYPVIPDERLVDASAYLTTYFDNFERSGNFYFKDSLLTFNIICHLDKWRIPSKLRPYAIMNEIDQIYNDKRTNGIGKTQFYRSKMVWVNKEFAGYMLQYRLTDFS
jgi:hypothetical protein